MSLVVEKPHGSSLALTMRLSSLLWRGQRKWQEIECTGENNQKLVEDLEKL